MNRTTDLLKGKIALVTGGTSGIGFHTAGALARLGAGVYVTGRDTGRGRQAERQLRATAGHDNVYFIAADASTVGSNQQLAQRLLAEIDQLHILVNNVGGLYNDRRETKDGYEATLAINFVGPFALTGALLPIIRPGAPARIVNVASSSHAMWPGDPFADIQARESYLGLLAHGRAKLLNIMWTFALARRLAGSGVVANAVNPGMAWTSQTKGIAPRAMPGWGRLFWPIFRLIQRRGSAEKAAHAPITLASSPELATVTGMYFESNGRPQGPAAATLDQANQEKAWKLGQSLVANAPTNVYAPTSSLGSPAGS
ncbi:MAG: SDR family NAD(P)-dependent oxidoreductase [Chloroflexi bacterium]|nr:SDR family NAD(P)-dependent oxidoreductase [Chloroflexota bacterium]MCI0579400.1 SDR family NAD(P)-dependent oxidoreductase [Chloroflexota bacterium]MCI0643774.1 SDR family NAD(P)-dependent oxidoreductase [Chloroflexota bacterium]MCI0730038.1 SDR family NAD(P)-dependent oxidoreductase [Chloroflexota bacterium]